VPDFEGFLSRDVRLLSEFWWVFRLSCLRGAGGAGNDFDTETVSGFRLLDAAEAVSVCSLKLEAHVSVAKHYFGPHYTCAWVH